MKLNEFLSRTPLFRGLTPEEVDTMQACLSPRLKKYERGEIIYRYGDFVTSLGIVLSGSVNIERCDAWGNNSIIDLVEPGEMFAESFACLKSEPLTMDAVANEKTEVIFFNVNKVLYLCASRCSYHNRLIENLTQSLARKNVALNNKMQYITPKTIRAKLIAYFSNEALRQGKLTIEIPFNRQQLADYLSVERSALSNELSKMQADGLIEYNKNVFKINIAGMEK